MFYTLKYSLLFINFNVFNYEGKYFEKVAFRICHQDCELV
jgi:hypothetical protein